MIAFGYFRQMPIVENSNYQPPVWFKNGHISTIYAGAVRKTVPPAYHREQWGLPDGDFLLVDFIKQNPQKAVILCHGLEGHSKSNHNNSAAHYFLKEGYSVFAWNNRSCGGKMNRMPQLYHHASIKDLDAVVQRIVNQGYQKIFLLGYSLGGAQILSYFGRMPIDPRVKAGCAVSTPMQLQSSAAKIKKGLGRIYAHRFIKKIRTKLLTKAQNFPELINADHVKSIKSFEDLAKAFIVPVHGFKNLDDYYKRASPGYSNHAVKTPALILNALNDPMMGAPDYPQKLAKTNPHIYLEMPKYGGHCAFPLPYYPFSYTECRAYQFFENCEN